MHNIETNQPHRKTIKRFHFSPTLARRRQKAKEKEEEERLKPKPIIGINTGYTGVSHSCPLTNTKFRGSCPITPCHYNITKYKKEGSCCLHIETGKSDFDKWDLQQNLEISESKMYKLKEQGELKVKSVVVFYTILNSLRDKKIELKKTENIANFLDVSHLELEEIQARKTDYLLIQNSIKEIEEKAAKIDPRLTLDRVLGTMEKINGDASTTINFNRTK